MLERHSKYWFEDGSVVLQVENSAYNLHRSFLEMKSPVWKDMFTMPVEQGSSEGVSLDNPIILPQITTAEFDELLSFLYHQWTPPPDRTERLVALLRLGNLYQIDDAKEFAITSLSTHPTVHPSLRLQLSREYSLDDWLAPAFTRLMVLPLVSLSEEDVHRLGLFAYSVLAKAKETVEAHRKSVAQSFPIVHLPYRHPNCYKSWKSTWWTEVGQILLHFPWTSWHDAMSRVAGAEMAGVCESCKPRYAHEVGEQAKVWHEQEMAIVDKAIARLR